MKKVWLALSALIFLALIGYLTSSVQKPRSSTTPASTQPNPSTSNQTIIKMTSEGFSPAKITISPGTTVKFVNEDTRPRWPASNIHPSHDILPEFDPKRSIDPTKDWSFQFEKPGIWRYHDHVLPDLVGTVTVE